MDFFLAVNETGNQFEERDFYKNSFLKKNYPPYSVDNSHKS